MPKLMSDSFIKLLLVKILTLKNENEWNNYKITTRLKPETYKNKNNR